jgi:predicted nucleic acid-binding protein
MPQQKSPQRDAVSHPMIISKSTPLIAFAQIGKLKLLEGIVGRVLVPEAVWEEVTGSSERIGAEPIRDASWVEMRAVAMVASDLLLLLDRGEAEVIALAEQLGAEEVLLDERAARAVALARGLNVIGSVGLLIRAKQRGLIEAVRPFLDQMQAQGMRYSRRFIEEVLRQLGE